MMSVRVALLLVLPLLAVAMDVEDHVAVPHGSVGIEWEFSTSAQDNSLDRLKIQYIIDGKDVEYYRVKVEDEVVIRVVGEDQAKMEFVTTPLPPAHVIPSILIMEALRNAWKGHTMHKVKPKGFFKFFKKDKNVRVDHTIGAARHSVKVATDTEQEAVVEEGDAILNDLPAGCQDMFRNRGVTARNWNGLQTNIDVPLRAFQLKNWPALFAVARKHEADMREWDMEPQLSGPEQATYEGIRDSVLKDMKKTDTEEEKGFAGLVALMRMQDHLFEKKTPKNKDLRTFLPKISPRMVNMEGFKDPWVETLMHSRPDLLKEFLLLEEHSITLKPVKVKTVDGAKRVVGEFRSDRGANAELREHRATILFNIIKDLWAIN